MNAHTPGPWTISEGARTDQWIVERVGTNSEDSEQVADAWGEENARLIAAAPALLEALERMVENDDDAAHGRKLRHPGRATYAKALAAIRAAKGETSEN